MENMAAGRFDVSWGRELCNYSKRDCYKNVACGLESSRFLCGSIDIKNGNCLSVDHRGSGKSSEIEKLGECGIELPPCKKRRISPIVLDGDDKGIGALFDNGLVRKNASVSKCVSLNQGKGVEVLLVDPMVRHGLLGSRLPVSQTNMCPSLPIEDYDDEQKEVLVEEEKCFQTQDNSMSRWASDSDSPRNVYLVNKDSFPAREEEVPNANSSKMSSLESGEFRREGSEEDKPRSLKIEEPGILAWGSINMLQACRSAFEYEKFNKINAGSYGIVYKAIDKKSGQHVALKKVKLEKEREGFPVTALREINILLSLNHPSIVNVKEVVMDDVDNVFIAMEYMEYDLQGLMETMTYLFSISEVKCLMLQLLEGVCYLHENWVLHRDLKTSNLLLNENGKLKICDFGLSRQYGCPLKPYTPLVVTLWYRAPELLLGRKQYSTAIDMWSVGCIMAELLTKKPLFQGESEIDQLNKIFRIMGTPNEMICPGFSKLQGPRAKFVQQHYNMLRKKFPGTSFVGPPALSDLGLDLLNKFLTYDPKKRITAEAALNHDWFREFPLPKYDFRPTFHGLRKSYL